MAKKKDILLIEESGKQTVLVEDKSSPILVEETSTTPKTSKPTAPPKPQKPSTTSGTVKQPVVEGPRVPVAPTINVNEFAGANRFVQELAKTFEEISESTKSQKTKWQKMVDALTVFPIPNTKAELFSFVVFVHSKMGERVGGEDESEKEAGAQLMTAYLNKYKECMLKVRSLFPAEPVFATLLSTYDADIRNAKKAIWWQKDHTILWVILGLAIMCVVGIMIGFFAEDTTSDSDEIETTETLVDETIKGLDGLVEETLSGIQSSKPTSDGVKKDNSSRSIELTSGKLIIPNDVEEIKANAYKNRKDITSVVIGDHVREIEEGAFRGCSNLITVVINSDEVVNKDYYFGASLSDIFGPQVTTYIIGESVRGIGRSAFAKCYDLNAIVISGSVRKIGNKAFAECSKLTCVTLNSNEIVSKDFEESLLGSATSTMEELFGPQVEEFVIGGDVREIGKHAFGNYRSMKKLTLDDNIETIRAFALEGCTGLTSVKLPNRLHQLGNCVFKNCTHLQSIIIPGSVESIGANCFRNCSNLSSVKISEGVRRIDSYAFSSCSKLTSFRIPRSLTDLGVDVFDGCNSLTTIYIPKGKKYNSSQTYRSDCRIIRY